MFQINVFNMLFKMWGARREQIVCRFISELLNPKGAHDKGNIYLKKFVTRVLNRGRLLSDGSVASALNVNTFDNATIHCEFEFYVRNPETNRKKAKIINGKKVTKRRMDIAIDLDNYCIAIEAKLKPVDSEEQCQDYYNEVVYETRNSYKMPLLYYLTKNGTAPAPISIGNLEHSKIRLISFEKEILPWLEDCLNNPQTKNDVALYDLMKKFYEALKKIL